MPAPLLSNYAANLARVNRALIIHRLVIGAGQHAFPVALVDDPFKGRPLSQPNPSAAADGVPSPAPRAARGLPNFRLPNGQVRK